jgi:hypothetical protein
MRTLYRLGIAGAIFGYFVACSPVQFQGLPAEGPGVTTKAYVCDKVCSGNSCIQRCSTEKTVGEGLVDILIVNDNSGSMSFEQAKMADRFSTFVQSLGSLDYRIAMTTTDISNRFSQSPSPSMNPYRNDGKQDGLLLEFTSGVKYIDRSTPNKETLFANTIKREETLTCEQSGFKTCPSSDERGIFAANLTLDQEGTVAQFLRPLAHLAIVILSDEDERGLSDSRSVLDDSDKQLITSFPLENYDKPETLVSRFKARFPEKTMSVHSIIVKPGDIACRNAQTGQGGNAWVRGVEGYSYAALTNLTGGKLGSICANDYGSQLTDIGYSLQEKVTSLPLKCHPLNDDFSVSLTPQPTTTIQAEADFSTMVVNFKGQMPPLTKIRLDYDCAAP